MGRVHIRSVRRPQVLCLADMLPGAFSCVPWTWGYIWLKPPFANNITVHLVPSTSVLTAACLNLVYLILTLNGKFTRETN